VLLTAHSLSVDDEGSLGQAAARLSYESRRPAQ
jgi:hypothetical protein